MGNKKMGHRIYYFFRPKNNVAENIVTAGHHFYLIYNVAFMQFSNILFINTSYPPFTISTPLSYVCVGPITYLSNIKPYSTPMHWFNVLLKLL